MALEILRDERVRRVAWRDLTRLSRREVASELLLSMPWLLASLLLASLGLWPVALLASFLFFLCGLRQAHNAFHGALGLSRGGDHAVLFALSVLMLGSLHAVRFNHLRHHRHCMDEHDVEAASARMPAWRALLFGPCFPVLLHAAALRLGDRPLRAWVGLELLASCAWVTAAVLLDVPALRYHAIAMAIGQSLTAFFAVWTVHHDCDRSHFIARTVRNPVRARVTYNMFFHTEHHLFPAVPTRRLPELARRLDRHAPELQTRRVF